MRAVGLITEYNPFHNGHLYHLQKSKELAGAEVAVAVMSGNFLQRGEAALLDKWRRTELALSAGVDLVVELPYLHACNSAPCFADGAVRALDALGGIGELCFGSESGELERLQCCADLLDSHSEVIEEQTRSQLRAGVNYPQARAETVGRLLKDAMLTDLLNAPNNILAIEYLRALRRNESSIRPLTLQRKGAGYHDLQGTGEIASATGIRHLLGEGGEVEDYLPSEVFQRLQDARSSGEGAEARNLFRLLLARILRGPKSLVSLYQVEAGLENRLFELAVSAASLGELIDELKVRQLTRTRVQRILCHILNEVEQEFAARHLRLGPLYLHLLGSSAAGERYLAASRKERQLPLVGNYSRVDIQLQRFYGRESRRLGQAREQLQLELRCSDNYALLQGDIKPKRQRDYYEAVRRYAE